MTGSRRWDVTAGDYDAQVVTPFARGVDFRLARDVDRILGAWRRDGSLHRRVAVDFGCGQGDGVALLADQVGLAIGLDFSAPLLDRCERRLRERGVASVQRVGTRGVGGMLAAQKQRSAFTNVLVRGDMRRLAAYRRKVDLALAITSISAPSANVSNAMFREVAASLKPDGTLVAVLASLDMLHYLYDLAARLGRPLRGAGRLEGDLFVENDERQKFFTPDEIRERCRECNLTITRLEKVRYPWRMMQSFGWGYFPRHPRLWDWYLVARPA
jgi:SAM-dependent methyltransferase